MKKFTLVAIAALSAMCASAENANEVVNGTFDAEGSVLETVNPAVESYGKWTFLSSDAALATGSIVDGDADHGKVLSYVHSGNVAWYNAFAYQDLTLVPQRYTLSFDAKMLSGSAKLCAFMYVSYEKPNYYAMLDGFDEVATPGASGGRLDATVGTEWTHIEKTFDLNYKINNLNSPTSVNKNGKWEKVATTADDLKQVRLCFNNNNKSGNSYLIDNVKLVGLDVPKAETSVEDVIAGESKAVEYFNLQGIRVENPSNGLFIKRQGGKLSKVVL